MRKTLLRITVGAAAAAAAVMGSGVAQADTANEEYPTIDSLNQQWNDAGGHIGYGATSAVSAAWLGVPAAAVDWVNLLVAPDTIDRVPAGE